MEQSIAYHLCSNKKFFYLFHKYLEEDMLQLDEARQSLKIAKSIYKDIHDAPGSPELVLSRAKRYSDEGALKYNDYVNLSVFLDDLPAVGDPEALARELSPVIQNRKRHVATLMAIEARSKRESLKDVSAYIEEIERIGAYVEGRAPIGLDGDEDGLFDAIAGLKNLSRLATSVDDLDLFLSGGPPQGGTSVILSRPGGGKSLAMAQFAAFAYGALGKNVAVVAIAEVPSPVFGARIVAPLLGRKIDDVISSPPEENKRLWRAFSEANKHRMGGLKIFDFESKTTVKEIRETVMRWYAQRGSKPDLVCFDYIGLTASHKAPQNANSYTRGEYVMGELADWAREDKLWFWTAAQAKKMGSGKGRAIIGLEDVADSYHIIRICDVAISLNVFDSTDGGPQQSQWMVVKHRMGQSGQLSALAPVQYARGLVGASAFFDGIHSRYWGSQTPSFLN